MPANAVNNLAEIHRKLGNVYNSVGNLNHAVEHYREAARYFEAANDLYYAGQTRFNIAVTFYQQGRYAEALPYAEEAVRNFAVYGAGAADWAERTQWLIELIREGMTSPRR